MLSACCRGPGLAWLLPGLLALGLGHWGMAGGIDQGGAMGSAPDPASQMTETSPRVDHQETGQTQDPQSLIDELRLRVQGMEGKLKDSAAARKSADQARMEAERRLAEGTQELTRQTAEIGLLRDAKLALEARLKRAEDQGGRAAEALSAAEESVRRLTAENEGQDLHVKALERQLDQAQEERRRADDRHRERQLALTEEQARLRASLGERQAELALVQAELNAAQAERDALGSRLDAVLSAIPAMDGGSLTLEEAQAQAASAALALRESLGRAEQQRDGSSRRAIRDAEQVLHRRQFTVARVSGARSVYRVRSADTLAQIAGRFYGDNGRWAEIHAANRHVLADPDHLTPGITLVIP